MNRNDKTSLYINNTLLRTTCRQNKSSGVGASIMYLLRNNEKECIVVKSLKIILKDSKLTTEPQG